eukprot:COSAG06_NODE_9466_length_1893_cov_2.308807_1_plen_54_part_10
MAAFIDRAWSFPWAGWALGDWGWALVLEGHGGTVRLDETQEGEDDPFAILAALL